MRSWGDPGHRTDRFIGRDRDIEQLRELYARGERLVTVVGPPGIGKTRLGLEYLRAVKGEGDGGVCFCDLSQARDDGELCAAVARSLGVGIERGNAHDRSAVSNALRSGKTRLLALDNLEQLASAAALRAAEWLRACPDLLLLATSRERLRIAGETSLELTPLGVPLAGERPGSADSVLLFVDRARARIPSFQLTPDNEAAVADISRLLGGVPLAIELAAARVGVLELPELVRRLRASLDVVARGERHPVPRHASLRAAVSWSWELLDAAEQSSLRQCAVFRGGFALEAAEAVLAVSGRSAEVLEVLHSLCDKSMLRAEARFGGPTRFELYFGVREFAAEELQRSGVEPEVRARHAAYYVNAGAEWAAEVERTGQHSPGYAAVSSDGRLALARERDNLLAAYEHLWNEGACAGEDLPRALQVILALEPVFVAHGPIDQLAGLLDAFFRHTGAASVTVVLRARALRARSKALQLTGMLDAAEHDIEDALALLSGEGDEWTLASIVADSGVLHHQRRHLEVARRRYEQALLLYEKLGSKRQEARLLGNVGALHHDLRDFEMAEAYYMRALERLRRLAEPGFEGNVLANLGVLAQEQERHEQSAEYFERAERLLQRAGDRRLLGIARGNWGVMEHERGRREAALSLLSSALRELQDVGDSASVALCLARLGAVKAALEAPEESEADIERARTLFSSEEDPLLATAVELYDAFRKVRSEAPASGDTIRSARSRMQRARQPLHEGRASAEDLSDDVRSALRLIEREVRRTEPLAPFLDAAPEDALVIGEGAAWFCAPRGVSQRLSQNGAVRRILLALVQAHEADPVQGLGMNELRDAGWPGERMTSDAATNRVHVALAELRRKGLKAYLERSAAGSYALGAGVRIHRVEGDTPAK